MTTGIARRASLAGILASVLALSPATPAAPMPPTVTQAATYNSDPIALGAAGYTLNFDVIWSSDDAPQGTTSAPGQIDLIDAGGALAGRITATIVGGSALVSVQGAGSVSGTNASVDQLGAGGTPANAILHGTWHVPDLGAGSYTLRFWRFQDAVPGLNATSIATVALEAGGSGPVGAVPGVPPAPPPGIALSAPQSATAFQQVAVSATATMPAHGNPLASVAIDMSWDGGANWTAVASDPRPSSPSDTEGAACSFAQAGSATIRATATDTEGLQASTEQTLAVAKANQPAIAITPASASVAPGQSVAFTASGGATGNYAWGGSASGSGPAQTVAFPAPGTYAVTAVDTGNSNYLASAAATARVTVQAPFYTLSVSATSGGTVSGGGAYPANAEATAVAVADPGSAFTGWTGNMTGSALTLSVLMNSNKAVLAHFAPLLAQTISFVPPGAVTTHSPPFTLSVSASSGLPVSLTLNAGPATLAADTLTPKGSAGEVTLTATQPGNAQYLPAPPVVIAFAVGLPPPGVLFADDSAATKRSDRETWTTSFRSGPAR